MGNPDKCPRVGKNFVCSLRGKATTGGRRKRGERADLGEVDMGLAGHSKEFLLYFKAKRNHRKI